VLILNTAICNILRTAKTRGQCKGQIKQTGQGPLGLATQLQPIDRIKPFVHSSRKRSASIICSAAMVSLLLDLLLHFIHVCYILNVGSFNFFLCDFNIIELLPFINSQLNQCNWSEKPFP
jgi:hypothetical protein